MDQECYRVLRDMDLPDVRLITLDEFERGDADLKSAKGNRTTIEYYFTCTPSLPLFVLRARPEVDLITYLDADMFFFADPEPIFDEFGSGSVLIIPHRFAPEHKYLEVLGIYNVGFLSFRNDRYGKECLQWWRERCLQWCYDRPEEDRYADQKYLDDWPSMFPEVVTLRCKGANLAAWNAGQYDLKGEENEVLVDEDRLIFYHFHSLRIMHPFYFDPALVFYGVGLSRVLKNQIYAPYLETIRNKIRLLDQYSSGTLRGGIQKGRTTLRSVYEMIAVNPILFLSGRDILELDMRPLLKLVSRAKRVLFDSSARATG